MAAQTLARTQQRENLIGAVGTLQNATASAPNVGNVQQQAQGLNAVAADPNELSPGSRTGAVALVSGIAGQNLSAVSNASSFAAVNALSSVSTAEGNTLAKVRRLLLESPGGGARRRLLAAQAQSSCGNLKNVVGAVSGLSETHLTGQAPGETPATVSTPNIQMATSLASNSTGGTGGIGAPGSGSSFDALPASALQQAAAGAKGSNNGSSAAAAGPVQDAVGVKFLATGFDFHSCGDGADPAFPGVSRLELGGAGGGTVPISNLKVPITFSLPPPKILEDGFLPQCTYWNTTQKAYVGDGCLSLPYAVPPGFSVVWDSTLETPDDATLVTGWSLEWDEEANDGAPNPLTYPAVIDPENDNVTEYGELCEVEFLDCTKTGDDAPEPVYLDPTRPIDVPVAKCPEEGEDPVGGLGILRVYTGHRCPLWKRPEGEAMNGTVFVTNGTLRGRMVVETPDFGAETKRRGGDTQM